MDNANEIPKEYSNGEVTITWKPGTCIHSTVCWKGENGLRTVFDPFRKPWIDPLAESTERIVEQIKKCPSGALGYYYNEKE